MTNDSPAASYEQAYNEAPPLPLYLFRHVRRWTQKELAREAGLTQETVSRIERGVEQPRELTKARLSAALGQPVDLLFPIQSDGARGLDGA